VSSCNSSEHFIFSFILLIVNESAASEFLFIFSVSFSRLSLLHSAELGELNGRQIRQDEARYYNWSNS
jgi:hypothetical protein